MRRECKILVLVILSVLLCFGCGTVEQKEEEKKDSSGQASAEVFAMDTIMDLTVYGDDAEEILSEAKQMIQKYESLFSVNIESSDVAKLNRSDGEPVSVSEETYELIQDSLKVSERTEGLFDISIYPLVRAWGFTTEQYRVPEEKEISRILKHVDYRKIRLGDDRTVALEKGMQIDLGGIAKGYLSQELTELFQRKNAQAAVVSLGGNVQTFGTKPDGSLFRVGITDPADGAGVLGMIEIGEKAVITSGSYQRYFEKDGKIYHHIMDKRTGAPAESDLRSVTVIADRGESADSLATALFVMGKKKAIEFDEKNEDIQLIMVDERNEVWTSEGITLTKTEE